MKTDWSVAKTLWLLLLWAVAQAAWAAGEAAVVVSLLGTVSAQKADGKVRVLAKDSQLMPGETVTTEKGSMARLRFSDGSHTTLRPSSRLMIEAYHYDAAAPERDSAVLKLVRGGMRAVSGAVGKRGNRDAYQAKTVAGTIGIRGTDYALLLCEKRQGDEPGNCDDLDVPETLRSDDAPAEGLYFTVFEGAILVANNASETVFPEGKSGYVRDADHAPQELPGDPGLAKEFPALGNLPGILNPFGNSLGACLVR